MNTNWLKITAWVLVAFSLALGPTSVAFADGKNDQGKNDQGNGKGNDKDKTEDKGKSDDKGKDQGDQGKKDDDKGDKDDKDDKGDKDDDKDKVSVCHKGHTLSISRNALQAHLNHGDTLGPCNVTPSQNR